MNPVRSHSTIIEVVAGLAGVMLILLAGHGANAQERPRYGGELVFVVPAEPAVLRRPPRGDVRADPPARAALQHPAPVRSRPTAPGTQGRSATSPSRGRSPRTAARTRSSSAAA